MAAPQQAEALRETISPADRTLWEALRETGRRLIGPSPPDFGTETTLFTEPLADYLQNLPAGSGVVESGLAALAAPFIPATRGDITGAAGNVVLSAMAPGGGGAARGAVGARAIPRRAESLLPTAKREAEFMRSILRSSARQPASSAERQAGMLFHDILNPWSPWGATAEAPVSNWVKRSVTGGLLSEALARAGLKPTGEQTEDWARKINVALGGTDYLAPEPR